MTKIDLGDRMKMYEAMETGRKCMPLLPVCARLDGRSFSQFTKGMERPFDQRLTDVMLETTRFLVHETNACMGYTNSDEITLAWYSDNTSSQIFFNGRLFKMTSTLSALASVKFNQLASQHWPELVTKAMPVFDCRVFQLPTLAEASNVFLWREREGTRNSISMACQHHYSHKTLQGKSRAEQHELLFQKGVNWNDYPASFKRGTYLQRRKVQRPFTEEEIVRIPEAHRPSPDALITRSDIIQLDMPPFGKVINRVEVIFQGEEPQLAEESDE